MSRAEPLFVLVDGSSYLFRAYYAMPLLTAPQGQPTGAMYGVVNMLRKLLKDYDPEFIAIVFDTKGPTFRHERFPAYKANRSEMPEDLAQQIEPLYEMLRAMGLPLVMHGGVEADDVIATLVTQAHDKPWRVLVSTGDKDLAQLVTDQVSLVNTMTGEQLDPEGVKNKFGVMPDQMIDYLTLVGDTADNIPGVPSVGPKTALKFLKQYGSLEELMLHAQDVKGKVGESLRLHMGDLALYRELVTVLRDVVLDVSLDTLVMQAPDQAQLQDMYQHFGFTRWIEDVPSSASPESDAGRSSEVCHMITTPAELAEWVGRCDAAKRWALDVETTSLNAMTAELVGVSLAVDGAEGAYIPLGHEEVAECLSQEAVCEALQPLLANPNYTMIGHNLKYDITVLRQQGLEIRCRLWDTLLAHYVLESAQTRRDLKTLAKEYLGRDMLEFSDVAGTGKKQLTFDQVPLDKAVPYAVADATAAWALAACFDARLQREPGLQTVFETIEMPLLSILQEMESCGVLIDSELLHQQSAHLEKEMAVLRDTIVTLAGEDFNVQSTQQLQRILFEKLGLPVLKKTPKGAPSTAENVLQELAVDYEVPQCILSYRHFSKLKSTYTDKLPAVVNPRTGRVHTSYNQAVTATGRLSSNQPNLQNIPVRTKEGRAIRRAFIASEGCDIVAADYSQIELRIMAHVSQDSNLMAAFADSLDVHAMTAAQLYGVSLAEVTSDQRRVAKTINFGLLYGMSAFGLSQQLRIERSEAQKYIETYFAQYPTVLSYLESSREQARHNGYVETLLGRRLLMPEIRSSNAMRRKAAERAAINAPLQGTAADIIKLAMISVQAYLTEEPRVKMVMQVHDELVFEVPTAECERVSVAIRERMEQAYTLSVPLIVEVGRGPNWEEAH